MYVLAGAAAVVDTTNDYYYYVCTARISRVSSSSPLTSPAVVQILTELHSICVKRVLKM